MIIHACGIVCATHLLTQKNAAELPKNSTANMRSFKRYFCFRFVSNLLFTKMKQKNQRNNSSIIFLQACSFAASYTRYNNCLKPVV